MRIKRETISNLVFVLILALLLFTPVGFHARVLVSKIFSFSPSELNKEEQLLLSSYNWELSGLNNETFDFKNVEGKVVLVNFWATWCPPCVAEMPSLQELHADYGDQVKFVMIANDEREKVKVFLEDKGYDFTVYFETTAAPKQLASTSIPTTFIIDKKGKIVIRKTGAANWNSTSTRELLENLLKQ